ncbi:hypothetical protein ACODM8_16185 [Vibrio ostreicida]|uniref:hypothetical protein n=1 Tax=Vibrio ostreicida TaxID=526588 RepID=UPI003B5A25B8
MSGYIQLVNKSDGKVIGQRIGKESDIEYCKSHVWWVTPEVEVIHVMESEFAQPWKFLCPVPRNTVVNVFADYLDSNAPKDLEPSWTGKACELESIDIAEDTWNAFTSDGQWVGTSEF